MQSLDKLQREHIYFLIKKGAFQFTDTFFCFPSGEIGPYRIETSVIQQDGIMGKKIYSDIAKHLNKQKLDFDLISGGEIMGWIFSNQIATELGKPSIMIDKDYKTKGERNIEGLKILQVDDTLRSGYTLENKWIPAINKGKGEIIYFYAYIDCEEKESESVKKILPCYSFMQLNEPTWKYLQKENAFTKKQYNSILKWKEDKEKWAIKKLRSKKGIEGLAKLLYAEPKQPRANRILNEQYSTIKEEIMKEVDLIIKNGTRTFDRHDVERKY